MYFPLGGFSKNTRTNITSSNIKKSKTDGELSDPTLKSKISKKSKKSKNDGEFSDPTVKSKK